MALNRTGERITKHTKKYAVDICDVPGGGVATIYPNDQGVKSKPPGWKARRLKARKVEKERKAKARRIEKTRKHRR